MKNVALNIQLTKSQIDNMIEFIEFNFIESIRNDDGIDNIDYVIDMMDALKALHCVSKYHQNNTTED